MFGGGGEGAERGGAVLVDSAILQSMVVPNHIKYALFLYRSCQSTSYLRLPKQWLGSSQSGSLEKFSRAGSFSTASLFASKFVKDKHDF